MSGSVPWSTVVPANRTSELAGAQLRPSHHRPQLLTELLKVAAASSPGPLPELSVRGVSADSQQVRPGDLFAALPGSRGHGALALLTDVSGASELAGLGLAGLPTLISTDPRAVLGPVSAQIYGHPSRALGVLGVTGTSGKTTTTFLVRAGLAAAGIESGLIGTVGIFLGPKVVKLPFTTPEAPQLQALLAVMAEQAISTVAMEVSSHALRLGRVDGTEFEVAAFTNLSQDHLDFHTDMADYFQAKSLLFDGRARREVVVIDDEWGQRLVRPRTVTVSAEGAPATWQAGQITTSPDGSTRFMVRGPGVTFAAGCRIPGRYNVANTLLACAILAEAGLDVPAVAGALATAQVPGRMERVDGSQPFLAVVDYSHKPAGVAGALRGLRPLTSGRLIVVLGCGGDRDRGKRPVMGEVAARGADLLIVTDDNPRSEDSGEIRAAMLAGARAVPAGQAGQIIEQGDRRQAIRAAISLAEPGDTVLVAGKGHETGQDVGGVMLPFDDVSVLRETLRDHGFSVADSGETATDRNVTGS